LRRGLALIFAGILVLAGVFLGFHEYAAPVHHRIIWLGVAALIGFGLVMLWEDLAGPV
jgi:hypothetical protein